MAKSGSQKQREKVCRKQVKHRTHEDALIAIGKSVRLARKKGRTIRVRLVPYQCKVCGFHHSGRADFKKGGSHGSKKSS